MKKLSAERIMKEGKEEGKKEKRGYYLVESKNETFFPGRSAEIWFRPGKEIENKEVEIENAPRVQPIESNPPPTQQQKTTTPLDSVKSALAEALPKLSNLKGKDVKIGNIGVLHPEVLQKFEIDYPCSAVEFCIEPFL